MDWNRWKGRISKYTIWNLLIFILLSNLNQKKVGDVDFYPNGGEAHQPGCEDEDAFGIDCSHARAPDFYIESITSDIGFLAWQCDNFQDFMAGFCYGRETNYMGEPANSAKPGIYFLQTNAQKPFAMPPTQN